jgi:hypothetical protein
MLRLYRYYLRLFRYYQVIATYHICPYNYFISIPQQPNIKETSYGELD